MRTARGEQMHQPPAPETQRSAEHAVERDGNHRRVHVFHDAFEAAPERQELADARDFAFGKNAHDFAGADGVAGGLQRVEQFAWPLFRRDGNGVPDFREGFYPALFVNVLEHQKPDRPVGGRDEQQRVGIGNVIADKQRAAFRGNVLAADDADAVKRIRDAPQQETQQRIRQQPHGVDAAGQRE